MKLSRNLKKLSAIGVLTHKAALMSLITFHASELRHYLSHCVEEHEAPIQQTQVILPLDRDTSDQHR